MAVDYAEAARVCGGLMDERTLKRGSMKKRNQAAVATMLTAGFVLMPMAWAQTTKKQHVEAKKPAPVSAEQLQQLKDELEGEINALKGALADRDAQLKRAQDAAEAAQQAAAKAEAAAGDQQQAATENASTVNTLNATVANLKASQQQMTATMATEHKTMEQQIEHPDAIHVKGITISPTGSFIAAETDYRSGATGGGLNTAFGAIPLANSDDAQISEFNGTGRQSRLALTATGKTKNMTMTGYYEMDWLGTGITSNNNQSNSYVLRQRQLWARAALNNGWKFTGGQMWSLATETTQGLTNGSEILPATIDPQYEAGFVWTRQYGFRVTKDFGRKFFMGVSAEDPQILLAGNGLPTNLLMGSAGTPGGLFNPTANYSFNVAPDFIIKAAFEPGWGHWEVFEINRFYRDRVYPNGAAKSAMGAYNDSTYTAGIGGGFRAPLANQKISIGLKGLWGQGMGRYGSSTIADVTLRPDGQIAPLRTLSALSTLEFFPNSRTYIYLNYGGDYVGRRYFGSEGYGSPLTNMTGCNTEPVPGGPFSPSTPANCGGNTKNINEFTAGYWYYFYKGPMGGLRQGIQYSYFVRDLWSGMGGPLNPNGGAQGTDNTLFTSFRYYFP